MSSFVAGVYSIVQAIAVYSDAYREINFRAQVRCESPGGRPGLPVPNSPYGLCGRKAPSNLRRYHSELRSCVNVEVDALDTVSLIAICLWT